MKDFAWFVATGLCLLATACSNSHSGSGAMYTLTVNSASPASGVSIAVAPADSNGASAGVTGFARTYFMPGAVVTLTAPATAGGNAFASWTGCTSSSGATCTVRLTTNVTVTASYGATTAPTVTLTSSPASIAAGASSTLTWTSTNATACTASGGWSGTEATSGTQSVSPTATTIYTLTCTGAGGSATANATVTVGSGSGSGWFTHIDCEGGTPGAQAGQGGANEFTETFSSTIYSTAQVGTGSQSCQMGITQGSDGWGQWGASYVFPSPLQNGSELWVRVSLFVPAGFDTTTNDGMLKFMRVHTASPSNTNEGYHDLLFASPGFESWSPGVGNWSAPYIYSYEGAAQLIGTGTVPANNIATGQWETYEMYLKFDPVSKDAGGKGEIRIWKNNQLLLDRTSGPTLVQASSFADLFYLFTYWNGNAPATQSLYVDDVIVTNQTPANTDANGYPFIGAPVMTSGSGTVVNGACGSAAGVAVSSPTKSNLCTSGAASVVSDSGPYAWMCIGSNGGRTARCSTNPVVGP
jgi:hypothetical protein